MLLKEPSMLSQSSTFLDDSNLEPYAIIDNHHEEIPEVKSDLHRRRSNASELSKIVMGIRDDHMLDASEYDAYNNPVEETLMEQLDQVSRNVTRNSTILNNDEENILIEEEKPDHPLDGGFAFWQAFLAMLMVFLTWGANAAFGVFLNLYLHNLMFKNATMYDFALLGGLVVCLANFLCPFTVLLVKVFGQTAVLLLGITIQTAGYLLAAQCTEFWQLFLCQGVMVGLSFALIFIPGTLVIPTWFDKHLALAMGLAVSGAGLGGLVFSFIVNKIISITLDQKWALRTVGLINLVISLFATVFMRVRNRQPTKYKVTLCKEYILGTLRVIFDLNVFKSIPFIISAVWFGIVLVGYVIILFSIAPYATSEGLSSKQATNVLAVLNALQVVGRPAIGRLGDYMGRNNASLILCLYVGLMLLAFWLNATDYTSIMILGAVIGAPAGVGSTMAQSMAHDILKFRGIPHKLPAAWGGMNILVSFFVLPAEVIALSLKKGTSKGSYRNAQIFTSCTFFFAALLLVINREWLVRQTLQARKKAALESLGSGKTSFLKNTDLEKKDTNDEVDALQARIERYDHLLKRNLFSFVVRTFYPIKV